MARDLTNDYANAITASDVVAAFLFHAEFDEGAVSLWSGYGDIIWNSITFTGAGDFGGLSEVEESENVQANGVSFTLSGIPSALISASLTYAYQGRPVTCWLAALNTSTNAIIPDPYPVFAGRMDTMTIAEGADTATISLTAESKLVELNRANSGRYTNEDQQERYPGDLGLEYVTALQSREDSWGVPYSATGSATKMGKGTRYVRQ